MARTGEGQGMDLPTYVATRSAGLLRLAWLLTALRHQRARESDLIYEAYYDAFHTHLTHDRGNGHTPLTAEPQR